MLPGTGDGWDGNQGTGPITAHGPGGEYGGCSEMAVECSNANGSGAGWMYTTSIPPFCNCSTHTVPFWEVINQYDWAQYNDGFNSWHAFSGCGGYALTQDSVLEGITEFLDCMMQFQNEFTQGGIGDFGGNEWTGAQWAMTGATAYVNCGFDMQSCNQSSWGMHSWWGYDNAPNPGPGGGGSDGGSGPKNWGNRRGGLMPRKRRIRRR